MKKTTDLVRQFYSLPTFDSMLSHSTLNKHSDLRWPDKGFQQIKVRTISFKAEILTLGVIINDEKEEELYLIIRPDEILVSCNTDTTGLYLSRHAYFGLFELTCAGGYYDFSKYYWPDFFCPKTGESSYLDISRDMEGILQVRLKPGNNLFYKPGEDVYIPKTEKHKLLQRPVASTTIVPFDQNRVGAIGYCIADTGLNALHTNHYPYLVPYSGVTVLQGNEIKRYIGFIKDQENGLALGYTPVQEKLNELCFRMTSNAAIHYAKPNSTYEQRIQTMNNNKDRVELLFEQWQQVIPLLQSQQYTHYLFTCGMKNVAGKPIRRDMKPCVFSPEVPELCFLWTDRGGHYELEMQFKIGQRVFVPNESNTAFFLNSKEEPMKFYLLGSFADYSMVSFFAGYKFKMSVLKVHYPGVFEDYLSQLAQCYELKINSK